MALTNASVQSTSQIPEFFRRIQQGQAPPQFTNQLLKDWGFTSSNHRAFIPLLKSLGFLSPDGKPTSRYHAYRDESQSKRVMGEALREAYSDIFLINAKPSRSDKQAIEGKFKSTHNTTDRMAGYMTTTFLALLELADLSREKKGDKGTIVKPVVEDKKPEVQTLASINPKATPSLHYDIQIHLPATKDVEVYNAIFKSLKENLFEE